MPLTRLAATAIDRTAEKRAEIVADVANYAATDLVCYRAEHPPALAARQEAMWQPLIDWAAGRYDAGLAVTAWHPAGGAIAGEPQGFAGVVAALDDFRLTALQAATGACGSLVIALALFEGRLDAGAAFAASQLDETFQIEAWGEDAEATAAPRKRSPPILRRRRGFSNCSPTDNWELSACAVLFSVRAYPWSPRLSDCWWRSSCRRSPRSPPAICRVARS
jgi:chaperone required for assembly of F1-ATPase